MSELVICRCKICGNIILKLKDSGVIPFCCGEEMTQLKANNNDVGSESHVPHLKIVETAIRVQIGFMKHPMMETHYVEWIILETDTGLHVRKLQPTGSPVAEFHLADGEKPLKVYEYCNQHGLWEYTVNCC